MTIRAVEKMTREADALSLPDYIDLIERLVHRLRDKRELPKIFARKKWGLLREYNDERWKEKTAYL